MEKYEGDDDDGACDSDDSDAPLDHGAQRSQPQPQPFPPSGGTMAGRLRHRGKARRHRACERFLERERVLEDDDQIHCTPEIAWKSAVMFLAFWFALSTAALDTDTDQPHVPPVVLRQQPQRHLQRRRAVEEGYCARLEVRPFVSFAAGASSPSSPSAAAGRRDTCAADTASSAAAATCTSDCPLDSRVVAMPHGAAVAFIESGVRRQVSGGGGGGDRHHDHRRRLPAVLIEVASAVGLTSTVHVSARVVGASGVARTFAARAPPRTWTISDTVCYPAAPAAPVASEGGRREGRVGAAGAGWSLDVAGCAVRHTLSVPLLSQDRVVEVSVASYYQPLASSRLPQEIATADGLPLSVLTRVHVAVHTLELLQAERG